MKAWPGERRINRSSDPQRALLLWLQALQERHRLPSVALADASGCLVVGSGPECDEMAAWAPLMTADAAAHAAPAPSGRSRAPRMKVVRVPGIEAYICADGAAELLEQAAAGCSRILEQRAA